MWTCKKCGRIFEKIDQPHSCNKVPLEKHFKNKEIAKELFDFLIKQINSKIGKCKIISLPCCIHLYGQYDFLAALPKKASLEVRIGLNRKLNSPKLTQAVPTSAKNFKNCFVISSLNDVDNEMMEWIKESYFLKN